MRNNNACYRCLGQGHSARFCRKDFVCKVENCGRRHHNLLHGADHYGQSHHGQRQLISKNGEVEGVMLQLQRVQGNTSSGEIRYINILWDGGSTLSFLNCVKDEFD